MEKIFGLVWIILVADTDWAPEICCIFNPRPAESGEKEAGSETGVLTPSVA